MYLPIKSGKMEENPVDYYEPTWAFQVRLTDGTFRTFYADDDSYDLLWLYCINKGYQVTQCQHHGKS